MGFRPGVGITALEMHFSALGGYCPHSRDSCLPRTPHSGCHGSLVSTINQHLKGQHHSILGKDQGNERKMFISSHTEGWRDPVKLPLFIQGWTTNNKKSSMALSHTAFILGILMGLSSGMWVSRICLCVLNWFTEPFWIVKTLEPWIGKEREDAKPRLKPVLPIVALLCQLLFESSLIVI